MRNLFDQYSQPENRLTHARAVCLDEDRRLLSQFLTWVGARSPQAAKALILEEQRLPGEAAGGADGEDADEEEAQRRGLPDLIIHDGQHWCLIVESKVNAARTANQLERHIRTLRRRGFDASGYCR